MLKVIPAACAMLPVGAVEGDGAAAAATAAATAVVVAEEADGRPGVGIRVKPQICKTRIKMGGACEGRRTVLSVSRTGEYLVELICAAGLLIAAKQL